MGIPKAGGHPAGHRPYFFQTIATFPIDLDAPAISSVLRKLVASDLVFNLTGVVFSQQHVPVVAGGHAVGQDMISGCSCITRAEHLASRFSLSPGA